MTTTKPYKPREGSMPARLIAHLQEHGGGHVDRADISRLLGIEQKLVQPNLQKAVAGGVLVLDDRGYCLPSSAPPAADAPARDDPWGGSGKPAFPSAPPRVGGPLPEAAAPTVDAEPPAAVAKPARQALRTIKQPKKMRTLKEVARQFHREDKAVGKSKARAMVVATKASVRSTAVAHLEPVDLQPASLRQVGGTHYKQMTVQPWDVVDGWPLELRIGYYRGNALKYLMRMGSKDRELLEIEKCQHYVTKLAEVLRERDAQVAA